jgi:site-specific DNA recombinase
MITALQRRMRCAIYTRKSGEEGLEQEFNSLDAQREAGESFIASQRAEGWAALPARYDDGGYTGGNMDRPALRQLLADVEAGLIDCVVVYKVDRLSRSLLDFTRIIETFDNHGVSFVSVTQQFNTTTSMGRLTLNILLSFAQFEREIIGERIRDKVAAAKKKGKHTGGMPILGYNIDNRRLVVNPAEAELVRHIFQRFLQLGSTVLLARELNAQGRHTKSWTTVKGVKRAGHPWNKSHLYRVLNNRKYIGEVAHRDQVYAGEHEAIVPRALWDEVNAVLAGHYRVRANKARAKTPALLKGLIQCGHCGGAMGITFTRRHGRLYRYYLCVNASKAGYDACPVKTVAAGEVEKAVLDQLRAVFRAPEMVARTFRAVKSQEARDLDQARCTKQDIKKAGRWDRESAEGIRTADQSIRRLETHPTTERDAFMALRDIDPLWNELFPAEQARIAKLLIERVVVKSDGLDLRIRADGLRSLLAELAPAAREVSTS